MASVPRDGRRRFGVSSGRTDNKVKFLDSLLVVFLFCQSGSMTYCYASYSEE